MKNTQIEGFQISPQQRDLWSLRQSSRQGLYHSHCSIDLEGRLDVALLEKALEKVVARYEILRTRFHSVGGLGFPLQVVGEEAAFGFEVFDLEASPAAERAAQVRRIAEEQNRRVDAVGDEFLRLAVVRFSEAEHRLLVSLSALLADSVSLTNLVKEVARAYSALQGTRESFEEPLQYADVADALNEFFEVDGAEAGKSYWRDQQLSGALDLRLPFEDTAAEPSVFEPCFASLDVPPDVVVAARTLAEEHGGSVADFFQAAWKALLWRMTGRDHLVLGVRFDCRDYDGLDQTLGLFAKFLPLRFEFTGKIPFHELLARGAQARSEATAWQDYFSWDLIAPEEAGESARPFLPFAFDFETNGFEYRAKDLKFSMGPFHSYSDRFKVRLACVEHHGHVSANFHYDAARLSADSVRRWMSSYRVLIDNALERPAAPIGELGIASRAERHRGLVELNDTSSLPEKEWRPLPELLSDAARRTPDRAAAVYGEQPLSYAELESRGNRLACHLRELGIASEDRVAVCFERALDLMVALVGVMKAGAAFVPLDPTYPKSRLAYLQDDAGVALLLTQQRLAADLEHRAGVLCLDSDGADIARHSDEPVAGAPAPDQLAYVMYTSGSTGRPKGVMISHRALGNYLAWCRSTYTFEEGSGVLVHSSLAFDLTITSLFAPLVMGGTVELAPRASRIDGLIEGLGAGPELGLLKLTPSHLEALGEGLGDASPRGARNLILGGEQLRGEHLRRWRESNPQSRIFNEYGPTEATVGCCVHRLAGGEELRGTIAIGRPIGDVELYVLDAFGQPVTAGVAGELMIGGTSLARGYHRKPRLSAERFVPNPFADRPGERLYKSGDLVRPDRHGALEYLERIDHQVKIRGYRIELGEIETVLADHPAVEAAFVTSHAAASGQVQLVAYVVTAAAGAESETLRRYLQQRLPDYMIPAFVVGLDEMPLTANGKVDREALPAPGESEGRSAAAYVAPRTELERSLAEIWKEVLEVDEVGLSDNFFDLGGHSFLVARVHRRLRDGLGHDVSMLDLFRYPTLRSLAEFLSGDSQAAALPNATAAAERTEDHEIAVIGMSGRFPGAADVEEFWRNLCGGVEAISFFTEDEVLEEGVDPELVRRPGYIRAKGVLEDADLFDAGFFGFSPREAELTDPQHRVFLECAWHALENAGYDSERYAGRIGVFAGVSMNTYLFNIYSNPEYRKTAGGLQLLVGNDKDFLPTRTAYKLNLRGPAVTVQTACSTSLVSVHMACRSLLHGEADMVLAGGSSVRLPQKAGYLHQEGGIGSPDGHCRAFDAKARGTVGGNGVGVVVMKRLADALADGDTIRAVIKGSAINNDGSLKIGYTAPSVEGQSQVIAAAQAMAGVSPDTVRYVENHGTGTQLGDPIEIAALTRAFRGATDERGFCALGSVKTNIGHLDAAAGVAGLIKTTLALERGQIPPSLHFEEPNPEIDFASSPFYVNAALAEWTPQPDVPRRAGVSSFGIGGTNAHVVLEESPPAEASGPSRPWQLLALSARTASALEAMTRNLESHLESRVESDLADLAYTLHVGRHRFDHRRILVCRDPAGALASLRSGESLHTACANGSAAAVAFLFPGQGAQYVDMGRELYDGESVFRDTVDRCCEGLRPELGRDLRELLYPEAEAREERRDELRQTAWTQPALFVVEYALAQLLLKWGIRPRAMIGHSLGEYVAACLAGVFPLDDALSLVAARGRLMQELPPGAMLSVAQPAAELEPRLGGEISLAAVNEPGRSVVAGPEAAIDRLEADLGGDGVITRRLRTSHAFHSPMMEPILETFARKVAEARLAPPSIPFVSNVTGTWITDEEATDPGYWARHIRHTVRFADGVEELMKDPSQVLLEVGPGRSLATSARRVAGRGAELPILSSMRHPRDESSDLEVLLTGLGRLWTAGVEPDWEGFYAEESRRRVPAPTYPFERQRYWIEAGEDPQPPAPGLTRRDDPSDWFYLPSWKRSLPPVAAVASESGETCLVFTDTSSLGERLVTRLRQLKHEVIPVRPGYGFARCQDGNYVLDPGSEQSYEALVGDLADRGKLPARIYHLWNLTDSDCEASAEHCTRLLDRGYYSLLFLLQAVAQRGAEQSLRIAVVTNAAYAVAGEPELEPEKAAQQSFSRVVPFEFPNVACQSFDVVVPAAGSGQESMLAERLAAELDRPASDPIVAYRGADRWIESFEPVHLEGRSGAGSTLRQGGVYLVTGGLGGIGLTLARYLAAELGARLVLVGRSEFPPRSAWGRWLDEHGEDDPISRKIRTLEAMEQAGGEVLVAQADVSDVETMRRVKRAALDRFGAVHGVIHAAGGAPGGMIALVRREQVASVLAPKVEGVRVLSNVFADADLDFVFLCSSLSSVLGQAGKIDYSAANAYLDAWAHHNALSGGPHTVAVNWDTWREVGMAVEEAITRGLDPEAAISAGLSCAEGWEVARRALESGLSRVVVSTRDLGAVRAQNELRLASRLAAELAQEPASAHAHPRPELAAAFVAPGNEVEATLAEIWQSLLGLDQVGVHDNFFELGGDSVVSLQVSAQANQAGLRLTPNQVFESQTIAELAAVVGTGTAILAEQGLVTGSVPLTPIQSWFFEQQPARPEHWNQALMMEVRQDFDPRIVEQALAELHLHHDVLRMRFRRRGEGWEQWVGEPEETAYLSCVDLGSLDDPAAALDAVTTQVQASLDLGRGPLARFVLLRLGGERSSRFLIVIHHLLVDAHSWRILLEDLETGFHRLSAGHTIALPPKTSSFQQWAERLSTYSPTAQEREYWLERSHADVRRLPRDFPEGLNTEASADRLVLELSAEQTSTLLHTLPKACHAEVSDALLASLAQAYAGWTGERSLSIHLEGHGRESPFEDIDLSRTVGWFTTLYPVRLELPAPPSSPQADLRCVKESLRSLPDGGISYGALRYMGDGAPPAELAGEPHPEVSFLYLGRLDPPSSDAEPALVPAAESAGASRAGEALRGHLHDVTVKVVDGRLRLIWTYSRNVHAPATMEGLMESFKAALTTLIEDCESGGTSSFSPTDFPLANLDQDQLGALLSVLGDGEGD